MNCVRGFSRLWIVASLVWFAIAGVFLHPPNVVEAYAANAYQLIAHPILMIRAASNREKD